MAGLDRLVLVAATKEIHSRLHMMTSLDHLVDIR
jgi:hypothetical protein